MQRQDTPTYHQMLKFGLSLGVLHVLCTPALADSTLTEIIDPEAELEADQKVSDQTATKSNHPQPTLENRDKQNRAKQIRDKQIGEQAFVPPTFAPPTFSGSHAQTTAKIALPPPAGSRSAESAESLVIPVEHTAETLSVREVDPLDLNLQDAEFSIEESWFELLSNAWIDDTISNVTDVESVNHTESVALAPTSEHEPAFTRVAKLEQLRSNIQTQQDIQPQQEETASVLAQTFSEGTEPETPAPEIIEPEIIEPEVIEPEITESAVTDAKLTDTELTDTELTDTELTDTVELSATSAEGEASSPARLGRDLLSEVLENHGVEPESYPVLDDELGTLRMVRLRSRENEELGILRILQTAQAEPPPPPAPIAFLGGRLGFVDVDNVFRTPNRFSEEVYQAGLSLYLAPKLSENTSIYAIAETNVARYNNFSQVNYNEVQVQLGLRQRLLPRTFAQVGWRNQRLYSPGFREKLFGVQYLDALVSHRQILSPKTWVDGFYQMRLGFADPQEASRFRQTFTVSFNYGISRNLRTSLLYQLDFDDYTQIDRYDTYQQLLGIVSYNITPESRLSVFGGTRFGRSSEAEINLDDTFYGAGLNVNVPLF